MSDFSRETVRTARKEHRCEEADQHGCVRTATIAPGTRYTVLSGVTDGSAWSVKFCMRCARAWSRAASRYWWDHDEPSSPSIGYLTSWLKGARRDGEETRKEREKRRARRDELAALVLSGKASPAERSAWMANLGEERS